MRLLAVILLEAGRLLAAAPVADGPRRFEYQQILMGVPVKVVVYGHEESLANAAVHAAYDRIRELNLIFSDYDDDSEISHLIRDSSLGRPVRVSAELDLVLAKSLDLSRRSEGAFDVTVGPLVDLWRKSRRSKQLPRPEALAAARNRVGYESLALDRGARTVELRKKGMRLDFGGIVKGYAADEARAVLKAKNFDRCLVALAGDVSAGEPPPGETGWRIGLSGLDADATKSEEFLLLRNCAVSTAGDMYQYVEIDGRRYSHLLNPRTGLGLTERISVTVVAPAGIDADGLDSAAAILGPEKGLQLIEQTPAASGRIIAATPSGVRTVQTRGFAKYLAGATKPESSPSPSPSAGTHP